MKTPYRYCAVCLLMLYPEEVYLRKAASLDNFPCEEWYFPPILSIEDNETMVVVCKKHSKDSHRRIKIEYPGRSLQDAMEDWNYKERSALSCVKIMSKVTRKQSANNSYCGHYEVKGSMWAEKNLEFYQLLYGGSLGIPYLKNMMDNIHKDKVCKMFEFLKTTNRIVRDHFDSKDFKQNLEAFLVHKLATTQSEATAREWIHNFVLSMEPTHPYAATHSFEDTLLGVRAGSSSRDAMDIKFGDITGLLALLFPYLYTNGCGYYSFATDTLENREINEEPEGGMAEANKRGETLGSYTKARVLMADRRFGRCTEFLFFMMDAIEKKNIHSSNRHVLAHDGRTRYTRSMVHDGANYNQQRTSLVPYTIRSSYAHKRKHNLNLQCMFENLGSPQLFLTFTCDDFSPVYANLLNGGKPWDDPILFARHFKRGWSELFQKYITKKNCAFSRKVGTVEDWAWTMEIQDRGSPHIHLVLWTGKTSQELMAMDDLVVARIPDRHDDPELPELVTSKQVHRCTSYCLNKDRCHVLTFNL